MSNEFCTDLGKCRTRQFLTLLALGGLVVLGGLFAFFTLEHHGHVLTGMSNQIVWGLPHVFAVFLIVAASGALNVASIGSVFGKPVYKARAPLSGMLALAMLVGNANTITLSLFAPANTLAALLALNFPEAGPNEVEVLMYAALVLMFITLLVNVFGSLIMLYAQRGNKQ